MKEKMSSKYFRAFSGKKKGNSRSFKNLHFLSPFYFRSCSAHLMVKALQNKDKISEIGFLTKPLKKSERFVSDRTQPVNNIFFKRSGSLGLVRSCIKRQRYVLTKTNKERNGKTVGSPLLDNSKVFLNLAFNKGILKNFVFWCFVNYGQAKTIKILEKLQLIGFSYATKAGISLSIDDLKIPPIKAMLLTDAEKSVEDGLLGYKKAQLTGLERFQRVIETWHKKSETLKDEMIDYFRKTDTLNPVYMMAFSGARGNVSQVRQLVAMRGLMSDPQGKILSFPIQSNFREGLTLTEYVISCYGARKGVVDTALRTANAGYLTRRLVDVAQHVIVLNFDCGTKQGFYLTEMTTLHKTLYPLRQRLIGRVLAADIYNPKQSLEKKFLATTSAVVARRNQEISEPLAQTIAKLTKKVFIRSPLTCATPRLVCQLCYGWSLSEGYLVSIGEAVGIIAAQSIGEPGTQLTMRTFHTGGVFSGEMFDQLIAPYDAIVSYSAPVPGTLIRTTQGKIAFLIKAEGLLSISKCENLEIDIPDQKDSFEKKSFKLPPYTVLFLRNNEKVFKDQLIAELAFLSSKVSQKSETAEFIVKSDLEGQIYSGSINFYEKYTNYNDIITQSKDWGTVWLLSGKICQLPLNSAFFALPGDLVDETSVLSEVKWFVPVKTLLDTNSVIKPIKKERYYDFSLNKHKWYSNKKTMLGKEGYSPSFRSPFFPLSKNGKRNLESLTFLFNLKLQKSKMLDSIVHKGQQVLRPSLFSSRHTRVRYPVSNVSKKIKNLHNPINNDCSFLGKLKYKLKSVENKTGKIKQSFSSLNEEKNTWKHLNTPVLKNSEIDHFFSIKNKINISLPLLLINVDSISYKTFGYFFSFFGYSWNFEKLPITENDKKFNRSAGSLTLGLGRSSDLQPRNDFDSKRSSSFLSSSFLSHRIEKNNQKSDNSLSAGASKVQSLFQRDREVAKLLCFEKPIFYECSPDIFFVPKLLEQRTKFWQKTYGSQETTKGVVFSSSTPTLNSKSPNSLSKDLFHWFPKKYLTLNGGICMYSFNYDSFPHYRNLKKNVNSLKPEYFSSGQVTEASFRLSKPARVFWVNQNFSKPKIYKVKIQKSVKYTDKVNSSNETKLSNSFCSGRVLSLTSFPFSQRDFIPRTGSNHISELWNGFHLYPFGTLNFSRTGYTTLKSFCLKPQTGKRRSMIQTKGFISLFEASLSVKNRNRSDLDSGRFGSRKAKLFFTTPSVNLPPRKGHAVFRDNNRNNGCIPALDNNVFLYKTKNLVSAISLHKKTLFPGQKLVDDVSFDSSVVYVQCFPESYLQETKKARTNCRGARRLNKDCFYTLEIKARHVNLKFCMKKYVLNKSLRFKTVINFSPNVLVQVSQQNTFILLIKKIREYPVYQPHYYKKVLYQSQKQTSFKFKSKVSNKIVKSKYHSQILNKQYPSLRLLEKCPKMQLVLDLNYKGLKKSMVKNFTHTLMNLNVYRKIECVEKSIFWKKTEERNHWKTQTRQKIRDSKEKQSDHPYSRVRVYRNGKDFAVLKPGGLSTTDSKSRFVPRNSVEVALGPFTGYSRKSLVPRCNIEFLTKSSIQLLTCKLSARQKSSSKSLAYIKLCKETKLKVFNEIKRITNWSYITLNFLDESLIALLRCESKPFKQWKLGTRSYPAGTLVNRSAKSVRVGARLTEPTLFSLWNQRAAILISTFSKSLFKPTEKYVYSATNLNNMIKKKPSLSFDKVIFPLLQIVPIWRSSYQLFDEVFSKNHQANSSLPFQNPCNLDQVQLSKEELYFSLYSSSFPIFSLFEPRIAEEIQQETNLIGDVKTASNLSQLERAFAASGTSFAEDYSWLSATNGNRPPADQRGIQNYFSKLFQPPKQNRSFSLLPFSSLVFLKSSKHTRNLISTKVENRQRVFRKKKNRYFVQLMKTSAADFSLADQKTQSLKTRKKKDRALPLLETKRNKYYKKHFLNSFSFFSFLDKKLNSENNTTSSTANFLFDWLSPRLRESENQTRTGNSIPPVLPNQSYFNSAPSFWQTRFGSQLAFFYYICRNLEAAKKSEGYYTLWADPVFFKSEKNDFFNIQLIGQTKTSQFAFVRKTAKKSERFFRKQYTKLQFERQNQKDLNKGKFNRNRSASSLTLGLGRRNDLQLDFDCRRSPSFPFMNLFDQYLPRKKRSTVYQFEDIQINPNSMSRILWEPNCYFNYDQKSHFPYFSKSMLRNSYFERIQSSPTNFMGLQNFQHLTELDVSVRRSLTGFQKNQKIERLRKNSSSFSLSLDLNRPHFNSFCQFLSIFHKNFADLQHLREFVFPGNGGSPDLSWDPEFSLLAGFFHQPCLYAFFSSHVTFGHNELMLENPYFKLSKKGLKTRMSFKSGFCSEQGELVKTSYLSPFKGEILRHESYYWSQNTQRNRYLFLTKADQISFYGENYLEQKHENSFISKKSVGQFLTKGDYLKLHSENVIISSESGILIHYNKFKITLRKAQSFFLSPNCIFHYSHGDLVERNKSILSLPYQQLKTGDIVQGIPKVEQLLEARSTFKGKEEEDNLHTLLIYVFELYKKKFSLKLSVRKAFSFIQLILVNSVQRIYRSQGVNISDKHLEVIVKQMTSKVQITSRGDSSFFRGEYVDLYIVETWNSLHPQLKKICYKPILLGISRSSLEVNSFLSAASFQHTKKVLSRSAFKTNIDFLNGLKENVIIGNLISAGTGSLTTNTLKQ